jgi:hypothetical protein
MHIQSNNNFNKNKQASNTAANQNSHSIGGTTIPNAQSNSNNAPNGGEVSSQGILEGGVSNGNAGAAPIGVAGFGHLSQFQGQSR